MAMMPRGKVPNPTAILRFTHFENLRTILSRRAMHAPNHMPQDGLPMRLTHDVAIQSARATRQITKGPGGTIHDYVPFYFGPWSPMMLNLHTGKVAGYTEGQRPLIYLVSTAQQVIQAGQGFVFTNGQALSHLSEQFDDLADLEQIDWALVREKYWRNTAEDPDRQRRKQAEFLVHRACPWELIRAIAVYDEEMKQTVEQTLSAFDPECQRPVEIRRSIYFSN
jgi:hypothetical protein